MLMGENSHAVAERVAEKVKEIQKQLPAGVVISPEYNRKNLVHRTIHTVTTNLFEGRVAGHSGAAVPPRKLARRADRCGGDPAGVSLCSSPE